MDVKLTLSKLATIGGSIDRWADTDFAIFRCDVIQTGFKRYWLIDTRTGRLLDDAATRSAIIAKAMEAEGMQRFGKEYADL